MLPNWTTTSYVILGIVELRGPSTSYDLKRAIGNSVGHFWQFPHSLLYSEPARLASHGLLLTQEENTGRRRRTYSITDKGRSILTEWLKAPTDDAFQIRNVAEIKLFFAEIVDHRYIVSLAEQQVEAHRKRLTMYEEMQKKFSHQAHLKLRMIPLNLGVRLERTALEFWQSLLETEDSRS